MAKLNFQQPLLQPSVSHDPSQINVENGCLMFFVETDAFSHDSENEQDWIINLL